jgi:hypothetical protein
MKNFFYIILISLTFISSTCSEKENDKHTSIAFTNNSDNSVYVISQFYYPDTLIKFYFTPEGNSFYKISAHSKGVPGHLTDNYEDRLKEIGKVMVFVFDAEVLETTPWETVKANYLVLKRYDLSLADLQRMNWTITYP